MASNRQILIEKPKFSKTDSPNFRCFLPSAHDVRGINTICARPQHNMCGSIAHNKISIKTSREDSQINYISSLIYSTFIQCFSILSSIHLMLFVCLGKVVCTTKILLSTHIDIIMVNIIQYSINSCH